MALGALGDRGGAAGASLERLDNVEVAVAENRSAGFSLTLSSGRGEHGGEREREVRRLLL